MQKPFIVNHTIHISSLSQPTHFRIYIIRPTAISAIMLGK